MAEFVDVSEPLREICDRIGVEYEDVVRLIISPGSVQASVMKRSPEGEHYTDGDLIAVAEHVTYIRT